MKSKNWTLLIHGGAGTLLKEKYSQQEILEYENALEESLLAGQQILQKGGRALDAVQRAVVVLEDCPLFNAGKGSVFNSDGIHELDASLMDGRDLRVGGVSGATRTKNPILAARMVLEHSPHCVFAGPGADLFAQAHQLEMVDQEYFFTPFRWKQWRESKYANKVQLDHSDQTKLNPTATPDKFGTVGAVALDQHGDLAAATSTGGLTNKAYGRVSDSAIIGAGTYANNKTCAVSTTGKGDYFIRAMTAADVSFLMEYQKLNLQQAGELALKKVVELGGEGGFIAVDKDGHSLMLKSTPGMFRGQITAEGKIMLEIF